MAVLRGRLNILELRKAAMSSPAIIAAAEEVARKGQDFWQSLPPATPDKGDEALHGKHHTGKYRDSIKVELTRELAHFHVRVYSDDPKAHWIEYGSKHMPVYAPMAKTRAYLKTLPGVMGI